MKKYTQEKIDCFKVDLQQWFDDYLRDEHESETGGEWESQLDAVFQAAYGDGNTGED